ncbi:MAG: DUF1634 domain-containing protein [Acidobacteriaceae bacterium]
MSRPTDHDIDLSVAAMLRVGVTAAAIVTAVGGLAYLRHPSLPTPDYSHFHAAGHALQTFSGIVGGVFHLKPRNIIQFGMVLLIATPVARVVLCVIGFARQRQRLYVAVSTTVLLVLLYSLTQGAR